MARSSVTVAAPVDDVWATLCDAWTYSAWVVGTMKIREVDGHWPAKGSKLHHSVGAWPIELRDETEVLDSQKERRLVLQARAWPAGEATIVIELVPDGERTTVVLHEEPSSGPGRWVNNRVLEAIGARRLTEMLQRLAPLIEGRRRDGTIRPKV